MITDTPSSGEPKTAFRRPALVIFLLLFGVGLAWSIYTQHAWEDYYITYRASKNLATGQGLTFTVGERLHSFTSPIGVLLPALASLLTGNSSDDAALWIFRLMSIAAFAGAGVLIWRTGRSIFRLPISAALLVALYATDSKTLDFSTNGMETAFLMLFMAWFCYALFAKPERQSLHLGLAWAGLMWTRPDAFIHIGLLSLGLFIFDSFTTGGEGRGKFIKTCLIAGSICTALYLPWLLWAWWYYGSPIPHTIVAKGFDHPTVSAGTYLSWLAEFPARIAEGSATLNTTFLPPYGAATAWPRLALGLSFLVALITGVIWLAPFIRGPIRAAAFAFLGAHFYLTFWPNYPFPWYIPPVTFFAFVTLCGLFDQGLHLAEIIKAQVNRSAAIRRSLLISGALLVAGTTTLSLMAAVQLKWQQRIIEIGQRKQIGLWLKAHAVTPHDSVFLEPLGYIGFYSQLKMYDWPGLASKEVIAARRRIVTPFGGADYWPELIRDLQPTWLVLRAKEVAAIRHRDGNLLTKQYKSRQVFDAQAEIARHPHLPGVAYLTSDQTFEVFQKDETANASFTEKPPRLIPITIDTFYSKKAAADVSVVNDPVPGTLFAHAPSLLAAKVPPHARQITGKYGMLAGSYADPAKGTDGTEFHIDLILADGTRRSLLAVPMDPLQRPEDRKNQVFTVDLPDLPDLRIELITGVGPRGNGAFDWTYWYDLNFSLPPY